VIIDLFVGPLLAFFAWLTGLLPEWSPSIPAVDGMVSKIAQLNSLLPIGPVIQLAVVLLGLLALFLTFRIALVVRHVLLP
jgi:hypothetical protein